MKNLTLELNVMSGYIVFLILFHEVKLNLQKTALEKSG